MMELFVKLINWYYVSDLTHQQRLTIFSEHFFTVVSFSVWIISWNLIPTMKKVRFNQSRMK